MTFRKYIRLCIVTIPVLLLIGILTFKIFIPYPDRDANITCENDFHENCRYVGNSNSSLYLYVTNSHPIWVDVTVGEIRSHAPLYISVQATRRIVRNAQIVDAQPFAMQGAEVGDYMRKLVGMPATVTLGIERQSTSVVLDKIAALECNDLNIKDEPGLYSASCYGKGWSGPVTFRAFGKDKEELEALRKGVLEEVEGRKLDYLLYRVVTYPLLVYIFLIVSVLTWLTVQAVRFVRRG